MKYRKEIDGLRAIAVIPVVLFHAGFELFQGGFVGVDVFFVISGYLITTIILSDLQAEKFSLIQFYERRVRRILPALFFVMFCCLPFAWFWLLPNDMKDFSESLIAVVLSVSNILFWRESGYFETAVDLKPLLHTWSLAVEEQFYIFFPLFLMILWKFRRQWILSAFVVVTVLSLVLTEWLVYRKPLAAFFLLPTRGWELSLGAMIAFVFMYKKAQLEWITSRRLVNEFFGGLGLGLIFFAVFMFNASTPFPSLYALVPTVGTVLIVVFVNRETLVGRFLSMRFMVGVGLISYSVYLWHQPLFVFARHRVLSEPGFSLLLVLSVASVVLGYFSWRFIENPFRDKTFINRSRVFIFTGLGSFFFMGVGVAGYFSEGFDSRLNSISSLGDASKKSDVLLADLSKRMRHNYGLSKECEGFVLSEHCRTAREPEILVWGDSYAKHLVSGILSANPEAKVLQLTKAGACGPVFDVAPTALGTDWAQACVDFNSEVRRWLEAGSSVQYVVLSSPFSYLFNGRELLTPDGFQAGTDELAIQYLDNTVRVLKSLGLRPVIFSPLPNSGRDLGRCLVKASQWGKALSVCDFNASQQSGMRKVNDLLRRVENQSDVPVVFFDERLCDEGICRASIDGVFIYRDYDHLTREGAAYLGREMGFYHLIVGE